MAINYLREHKDAEETKRLVEEKERKCILIPGDISDPDFCKECVERAVKGFGRDMLDILVNNAATQYLRTDLRDISQEQLEKTFQTNIYSMFYMTQNALNYMKDHSQCCIINTTSINACRGMDVLIDYSSTKSAIVGFTRSLAKNLAKRGIRVNAVASGPIWTPFIPGSFTEKQVKNFGKDTAMGRAGQPFECATCYQKIAPISLDRSYIPMKVRLSMLELLQPQTWNKNLSQNLVVFRAKNFRPL